MNLIITLLVTLASCEIRRVPLKYNNNQNVLRDMANMLQKSQAELFEQPEYTHVTEEGLIQMSTSHKKKHHLKHQQRHDKHNHKLIHDAEPLMNVLPLNEEEEKMVNTLQPMDSELENEMESQTQKLVTNAPYKGHVPLTNMGNTMFIGEMNVGNHKGNNAFDVIFDTGSALTCIASELCNDIGCRKSKRYDHKESSSFKEIGKKVEIVFGSGTLRGLIHREEINVDGIMLKDALFIEITQQIGDAFHSGEFDGIVGLGFPHMTMAPTLFDYMMTQHKLDQNEFTFHLSREVGSSGSELIFGGHDDSQIKGQWNYHKVTEPFYWSIMAEQIRVGDRDSGVCTQDKKCKMAVDTGTTLLTGPSTDVKKLLSMIKVEPRCQNFRQMPDITFVIDGVDYVLTPEDYILTITNKGVESPYVHSPDADLISCAGTIFPLDLPPKQGPLWILGDIFITKYSAIFDRANQRVGLGLSAAYKQ